MEQKIILLIVFLPFQFVSAAKDNNELLIAYNCTGNTKRASISASASYIYNLYNLLGNFTSQASIIGYYKASTGQHPNRVYALYMCRGDANSQICSACVNQAKNQILKVCPYQTEASIWYDNCMMRYSRYSFFRKMDLSPWVPIMKPQNISKSQIPYFMESMRMTMNNLATLTADDKSPSKKFQTTVVNITGIGKLYELAHCIPDLTVTDCHLCLMTAIERLPISVSARALLPSCAVHYQTTPFFKSPLESSYPFFNTSSQMLPPRSPPSKSATSIILKRKKKSLQIALAVSLPIVFVLFFFSSGVYFYINKHRTATSSPELDEIITVESLQFDFKMIRVATNNFSLDNKLGEGGFGIVYKGRLPNGHEIAVKRLSTNSGQGIKEFKTEVLLVAKLQHKNLVKLLGFCLFGNEKLLVYEFLPNSSLDKVLMDPSKHSLLDWNTRYKIILGIARGLLYLHEDSRVKVIHRDLKSSNIMLDESMNPKISDFGLARLVGADQIQGDTNRIVGTYGYMAPEYAMAGRFSVKSDVYSFGVIVLEIISGHKCSSIAFPYQEESIFQRAWRLWKIDAALDLMDHRLKGNFSSDEATKCIHIGLLSIQEDVNKRPTMVPIVSVLNGHSVTLSEPTSPQLICTFANSNFGQSSSNISGSEEITEVYPR